MWIFTRHGYFSAVCAHRGDGAHGQPVDPNRIMVRARLRSHLKALRDRFPDLLGECVIQEFAGAEYAFRLFVQELAWTRVLEELAEETVEDAAKLWVVLIDYHC